MTKPKTTPSLPTGATLTELKARVWWAGLRLWMWRYQPHLRVRPKWDTKIVNEIEFNEPAEIFYKHVKCIPVWNIDQTEIVWYYLYTIEGYWLGRITHLRYLEEANASKVKV